MARKNLLDSVLGKGSDQESSQTRSNYALKGASGKMKASLDTLADNAKRMLEGETIVEIEPELIDDSFVNDRLSGDDDEYQNLKSTIERDGQDTPVLLRPHPDSQDRYMIVFGHRRVRVARELSRPVRAVVKPMDDLAHVLAQGQENSARSDLSFIEKAIFAKRLLDLGQQKDVIQKALTVDATLLSRMLSVSQKIPVELIEAIGPAKSVGRDRWEALKKLAVLPTNKKRAVGLTTIDGFRALSSDERFERLLETLSQTGAKPRRSAKSPARAQWTANGGQIKGAYGRSGKSFNISLTSEDAEGFGGYIAENLDTLYQAFRDSQKEKSQ